MTRRKSPVCLPPLTRPCLILKLCCQKNGGYAYELELPENLYYLYTAEDAGSTAGINACVREDT